MKQPDVDQLEMRALEERQQIHQSVEALKSQVTQARQALDPKRNARKYFLGASIAVSALAFLSGYGLAGAFTE